MKVASFHRNLLLSMPHYLRKHHSYLTKHTPSILMEIVWLCMFNFVILFI